MVIVYRIRKFCSDIGRGECLRGRVSWFRKGEEGIIVSIYLLEKL